MTDRDETTGEDQTFRAGSPPAAGPTSVVAATRRTVLLGVGAVGVGALGVGAVGALAACGGGSNPPAGGQTTPPLTPEVMKTSGVPVGGGTVFKNANVVVTQPVAGTFKAFDATCQHLGCQVGSVSDGKINCPCHGSQYNIADGSVARGPTTRGLNTKTVTVTGDTITVS